MQGINRVDSWAQFMSLVQDARMRNQGIAPATRTAGSSPVKRTQRAAANAAGSLYPVQSAPVKSGLESAKTKVLGGRFDAYA